MENLSARRLGRNLRHFLVDGCVFLELKKLRGKIKDRAKLARYADLNYMYICRRKADLTSAPFQRLPLRTPVPPISSRRVFLRNTTSGISDRICKENYHTFALGRDRKFHVCSKFPCEIVCLRNTRPDEIRTTLPTCPNAEVVGLRKQIHAKSQNQRELDSQNQRELDFRGLASGVRLTVEGWRVSLILSN